MATQPVGIRLRALDSMSKVLDRVSNKFPKLQKAIQTTSNKMSAFNAKTRAMRDSLNKAGSKLRNTGKSLTLGLTAPIGLAGGAIIKTAVSFQKSINRVGALTRTIIKGQVTPEFESLENEALRLGSTTAFSASQAADAMALLGQQGFKANEIITATGDVLNLAAAANVELSDAADVSGKTLKQFGLDISQMTRVTDVLALTMASSNVNLDDLKETFKAAAPIARAYGATLEQTAAITGLLGDVGIQGSMAGTALKNTFLQLATPSARAKKILMAMGVATTTASGGMREVGEIIKDIGPKLANLPKNAQLDALNELFGLRGIAGASALMAKAMDEGENPVTKFAENLKNANGAAKDMADTLLRGAPGSLARFNSAVEGLALSIAKSGLLDAFASILEFLANLASKLSTVSPTLLKMGTIFLGLVAIVGPLIAGIGFMASGIAALIPIIGGLSVAGTVLGGVIALLSSPITLTIAGIVGLIAVGAILMDNWTEIMDFFSIGWEKLFGLFDTGLAKIKSVAAAIAAPAIAIGEALGFGGGATTGADVGAKTGNKGMARRDVGQSVNGAIDVNFRNAPKGTSARSNMSGPLDLNLGFAGGLQ